MINSFKNFERLRYRLSNDIKNYIDSRNGNTNETKEQISNTIFATIFSAFLTETAFTNNNNVCSNTNYEFLSIISKIAIYIVIYIASYFLYNIIYTKSVKEWKKRKIHSLDTSELTMTQIQKDFDNIACDSIIVANDYKKEYETYNSSIENQNIRTFLLF